MGTVPYSCYLRSSTSIIDAKRQAVIGKGEVELRQPVVSAWTSIVRITRALPEHNGPYSTLAKSAL